MPELQHHERPAAGSTPIRGRRRSTGLAQLIRSASPQAAALLCVALVFGGGGVSQGIYNLIVQLCALGLLAANGDRVLAFFRTAPRPLRWLAGLSLALPLIQLVPLPPALWGRLPGHDLVARALGLIGEADSWRPITVNAHRGMLAFIGLIAPFTVLAIVGRPAAEDVRFYMRLVVALGLACFLLGAFQFASANRLAVLHDETIGQSELYGTFANRNSTGLFFVIALVALAAVAARERAGGLPRLLSGLVAAALIIGVVLTHSRSSMALLAVPAAFFVLLQWRRRGGLVRSRGARMAIVAGIGVLALAGVVLGMTNARLGAGLTRFDELQDTRLLIWQDARITLERFSPMGAGIGTFDEVFQIDESMEHLDPAKAGRAHNDYLEIAIEAGLPGLALLAAWLGWLGLGGWRVLRANDRIEEQAAAMVIAAIALQSIIDYPLRNQTLQCIAALMVAILVCRGDTGLTRRNAEGGHS